MHKAVKILSYIVAIIGVGLLISFFDSANDWLGSTYPNFPVWAMPLVLSMIIVGIGVLIRRQLHEGEILKYEFITTVTHKFRTPLTHIKWATENLRKAATEADRNESLGYIENANSKLVELTDLLVTASEPKDDVYKYRIERANLSSFAEEMIVSSADHANAKKIQVIREISPDVHALFDASRLKFVFQTLIENGINYTGQGGHRKSHRKRQ
ncbi:MAG: HAMP domain-containing sensor histidine kinase [Candidatus Taylorbacteria bacterium]|nr:HAMP domain-containing sensor histidine kinase [Candidatus Taylorbacteria bacterium]